MTYIHIHADMFVCNYLCHHIIPWCMQKIDVINRSILVHSFIIINIMSK